MARTPLLMLTCLLVVLVLSVQAQSLFSTYLATPEAAASGGGVLGRSNALGCGRDCGQDTSCRGYFVAENSPDSCVLFTDGSNGTGTTGTGTFYWKVPEAKVPRTCAELAVQRGTDLPMGQYQIDPDGAGGLDPITVTCYTNRRTVTVADHDRLTTETVYGGNDAWEVEYGYRHTITYNAAVTQLQTLTTLSAGCRMDVHIRCLEVLFEDPTGRPQAGWVAYDGTVFPMTQGADVCPIKTPPVRKCNCDNAAMWISDAGYITDQANFPIQALAFGDLGSENESLQITLGPMECVGQAECGFLPDITFATKTVEGRAVGKVVSYYCFPGLVFEDGSDWMELTCRPDGTWETPMYTQCHLDP